MKARFNRAVLSLQAAAEDLEHIEPNMLDPSMDKGRVELSDYVQAALAVVGERSNISRDKASDQSAKGVVLVRPSPVKAPITVVAEGSAASAVAARKPVMQPVVIRGGMNDGASQEPDKRAITPH
jgi:hypothetical protein